MPFIIQEVTFLYFLKFIWFFLIYDSVSVKWLYYFSRCFCGSKMIDEEKYPKILHKPSYKIKNKLLHSDK